MPFLSVAGIEVRVADFRESQRIVRGEAVRAFDNTLLDGEDAGKRAYEAETVPMAPAAAAALRAAVGAGPVVCTGDALDGATTCKVRITAAPFRRSRSTFYKALSLTLEEV